MILPEINFTFLDYITSVPSHLHNYAIHFVIVLPVVLLLFEITNMIFKRRVFNVINIGLIILITLSFLGAYATGIADAQSTLNLGNKEISNAIIEHKTIGTYILLFGVSFIIMFKTIAILAQKALYTILYILIIMLFIFITFTESQTGRELVDRYGINITKVAQMSQMQMELNATNTKQSLQIIEMNKTIQLMRLKELNATQTIEKLRDQNMTKESNVSDMIKSIF